MARVTDTGSDAVRTIQKAIKAKMEEEQVKGYQLASRMDVPPGTVSRWLSGSRLELGVAAEMAEELGTSLVELFDLGKAASRCTAHSLLMGPFGRPAIAS